MDFVRPVLVLLCVAAFATCWTAGMAQWRRGAPAPMGCAACVVGSLAAMAVGGPLLGFPTGLPVLFTGGVIACYGFVLRDIGFVWLKKRLARKGRALGPFWAEVDDRYLSWPRSNPDAPTELVSADAPTGRGTEPEASLAPAGRGNELVGVAEPGTSANTEVCEAVPRADRERG